MVNNEAFRPYLRKFVLVFFYDILVYSRYLLKHLTHLKQVLKTLKQHRLFAKLNKCKFGLNELIIWSTSF